MYDANDLLFIQEEVLPLARDLSVPAKATLLREGVTSKNLYFIEEGIIRMWFNHNGKDITFQFFVSGDFVSSIESFFKRIPSDFSIETLKPCKLKVIDRDELASRFQNSERAKEFLINLLSKRLY
ncbi:MAG: Crp/Fnr family transcriptional regulator, partial [Bacteroidota bacterium]